MVERIYEEEVKDPLVRGLITAADEADVFIPDPSIYERFADHSGSFRSVAQRAKEQAYQTAKLLARSTTRMPLVLGMGWSKILKAEKAAFSGSKGKGAAAYEERLRFTSVPKPTRSDCPPLRAQLAETLGHLGYTNGYEIAGVLDAVEVALTTNKRVVMATGNEQHVAMLQALSQEFKSDGTHRPRLTVYCKGKSYEATRFEPERNGSSSPASAALDAALTIARDERKRQQFLNRPAAQEDRSLGVPRPTARGHIVEYDDRTQKELERGTVVSNRRKLEARIAQYETLQEHFASEDPDSGEKTYHPVTKDTPIDDQLYSRMEKAEEVGSFEHIVREVAGKTDSERVHTPITIATVQKYLEDRIDTCGQESTALAARADQLEKEIEKLPIAPRRVVRRRALRRRREESAPYDHEDESDEERAFEELPEHLQNDPFEGLEEGLRHRGPPRKPTYAPRVKRKHRSAYDQGTFEWLLDQRLGNLTGMLVSGDTPRKTHYKKATKLSDSRFKEVARELGDLVDGRRIRYGAATINKLIDALTRDEWNAIIADERLDPADYDFSALIASPFREGTLADVLYTRLCTHSGILLAEGKRYLNTVFKDGVGHDFGFFGALRESGADRRGRTIAFTKHWLEDFVTTIPQEVWRAILEEEGKDVEQYDLSELPTLAAPLQSATPAPPPRQPRDNPFEIDSLEHVVYAHAEGELGDIHEGDQFGKGAFGSSLGYSTVGFRQLAQRTGAETTTKKVMYSDAWFARVVQAMPKKKLVAILEAAGKDVEQYFPDQPPRRTVTAPPPASLDGVVDFSGAGAADQLYALLCRQAGGELQDGTWYKKGVMKNGWGLGFATTRKALEALRANTTSHTWQYTKEMKSALPSALHEGTLRRVLREKGSPLPKKKRAQSRRKSTDDPMPSGRSAPPEIKERIFRERLGVAPGQTVELRKTVVRDAMEVSNLQYTAIVTDEGLRDERFAPMMQLRRGKKKMTLNDEIIRRLARSSHITVEQ